MMQNLVISLLMSASAAVASGGSHGAFKARASVPEAREQNVQKWDFTKIANPSVPAPIEDFAQSQGAGATHEYFGTAEWNDVWALQSWSKEASKDAPTRMTNSLNNIYIQQNTDAGAAADETFLTLRTVRHDGFQSAAEIESRRHDYQYVTMKMRARTVGDAGACTAMFTYYLPDGGKVQEADLEILTKEADNIAHYTNQPSYDGDQEFPEATGKSDCYSPLIGQERKEEEKEERLTATHARSGGHSPDVLEHLAGAHPGVDSGIVGLVRGRAEGGLDPVPSPRRPGHPPLQRLERWWLVVGQQ